MWKLNAGPTFRCDPYGRDGSPDLLDLNGSEQPSKGISSNSAWMPGSDSFSPARSFALAALLVGTDFKKPAMKNGMKK